MKKLFIMLLFLICLPVFVNAKEYCTVTSGTGKDIGDEVVCGTEHFYIFKVENDNIKMLAKYNLLVGDKIDYIEYEADDNVYFANINRDTLSNICKEYATAKGYSPYYSYAKTSEINSTDIKIDGCRVYERLNSDIVRQDERAVGTKLVDGKSVLPLYGIVYMDPNWGYEAMHDHMVYSNVYDDNGNLIIEGTPFKTFLDGYKTELERQNYQVESVSFVTLNGILDFLRTVSGNTVQVNLEYSGSSDPEEEYVGKMDIKQYVPNKYKWIYDSTYWFGSGFTGDPLTNQYNDYYMSNEGFLCALGRGECIILPYPIGNGLRPVVTINSENIKYLIETETNGYGTIEAVDSAFGGDEITFRVSNRSGYRLRSITVTDETGGEVTFDEEDITNNDDGTVTIVTGKFTMPESNVKIRAEFVPIQEAEGNTPNNTVKPTNYNSSNKIENPNTGIGALKHFFIIILCEIIGLYILVKVGKTYVKEL